jgi:GNAT superfamily N-acetyltransferase
LPLAAVRARLRQFKAMSAIRFSVSTDDIERCYAVMQELRPDLKPEEFVGRVRRQEEAGYRLLYLEDLGEVKAVAGFRVLENLAWGKFLYVDDLVTKPADHGKGYGGALFEWLLQHALGQGCGQVHLDSGVQRFGAHRFYLGKGMAITSHHFAVKLR